MMKSIYRFDDRFTLCGKSFIFSVFLEPSKYHQTATRICSASAWRLIKVARMLIAGPPAQEICVTQLYERYVEYGMRSAARAFPRLFSSSQ